MVRTTQFFALAVMLACTRRQPDDGAGTINQPFAVNGARVEPDSLNAYLAAHRGFTSRGGEMRCAYAPLGQDGTRVFVWAVCGELLAMDDRLAEGSGMSLPAAFEIDVEGTRARVVGVAVPEDGDRYAPSIRRIFPASIWPRLNTPDRNQRVAAIGNRLRMEAAARLGLLPSAASAPRLHAPFPDARGPIDGGRPGAIDSAATLDSAARRVVAFLRRRIAFEQIALSDSVTLYVSPEGGSGRATLTREQLRRPSAWVVRSGGHDFSLVPPAGMMKLTTKVGRHFNCSEKRLAALFPELARLPHVGTMLKPENAGSCLQTWNVTFVFDASASPRLVAAVYDQWEW